MKQRFLIFICMVLGIIHGMHGEWVDLYRKGYIRIEPEKTFGNEVDWDSLFFDRKKHLVVADDGRIFVIDSTNHRIFTFDSRGNLIGQFGRQGQGPGDLYHPGCRSILDGKYLVVSDYAESRRISLFDLSGKCVKILKTRHSCFNAVGLKDNQVAYFSLTSPTSHRKNITINQVSIILKNVNTGNESLIDSFELESRSIPLPNGGAFAPGNFIGDVAMEQTAKGNLLVGVSNSKEINIYSPKGKLLKTFTLALSPIPVTNAYIEKVMKGVSESIREDPLPREVYLMMKRALKRDDFKKIFGKYLPYYHRIIVDSSGNILVFKWFECMDMVHKKFQVYSAGGKFICEAVLDDGLYKIDISSHFGAIRFTNHGIIGLYQLDRDDDYYIRLVKTAVK